MPLSAFSKADPIADTTAAVVSAYPHAPKVGIILGSGLGEFANRLPQATTVPYGDLPHFPESSVAGHAGCLTLGEWQNTGHHIACLQGRFHAYEGYDQGQVIYPVRLLKALGIDTLIVTNAAGGINTNFRAGDLMLIRDHLNLTGKNPLIGPNDDSIGPRFPDMTEAYDTELRRIALASATAQDIPLQQGVYAGLLGPCYETPAEVRMLRTLGADAVGMSTVTEVITARHAGLRVLGLSCITNAAATEGNETLTHEDVIATGQHSAERFQTLLTGILNALLA